MARAVQRYKFGEKRDERRESAVLGRVKRINRSPYRVSEFYQSMFESIEA